MKRISLAAIFISAMLLLTACSGVAIDPVENEPESNQAAGELASTEEADSDTSESELAVEEQEVSSMKLTSPAFEAGSAIPEEFSCDGEDMSPPLRWSGAPAGVASFALIMDDPDAPVGTWDHWLLYNIPAEVDGLAPAVPSQARLDNGSLHGSNSWGNQEYGGPCPPGGTHRYFFQLFALDELLDLEAGASKSELQSAMDGHILEQAELMGTYSR